MATLGFRIDTDEQIACDHTDNSLAVASINNIKDYIGALYNLTMETINRSNLTEADWQRTVSISCGEIGPKIKRLSTEEKNLLLDNGRKGVRVYFD